MAHNNCLDRALERSGAGYVADMKADGKASRREPLRQLLAVVRIAIENGHARAQLREQFHGGSADTFGAAGDHGNPIGKSDVHAFPPA